MKWNFAIIGLIFSQMAWGSPVCTARQVEGTYAFLANGSILLPNSPLAGPFMRIGEFIADGKGGIVFTTLALYAGINFGSEHFTGTYTVNSDCEIDLLVAVPQPVNSNVGFKGQVAAGGDDVTFILVTTESPQAPPITTVVGFGRKRQIARCSVAGLGGDWRIELNGFRNLPPLGTGTAYRTVGRIQADGKGGLLASFTTSNGGTISQETAAGTYTVASDCTFDLNYTIAGAPFSVRGSLIGPDEAFASLNLPGQPLPPPNIGLLSGAVATGSMVKETSSHEDRGHGGRY